MADKDQKTRTEENIEDEEILNQVIGGIKENGGMICPQCGFMMPISMYQIMQSTPIDCPNCHLALRIDREKSIDVLKRLQEIEEASKKDIRIIRMREGAEVPEGYQS